MEKKTTVFQIIMVILSLIALDLRAQVNISNPNHNPSGSVMLDISSTDKGLLIPRLTSEERNLIPSPAAGLLIYNTSTNLFNFFNGSEWYQLEATYVTANTGTLRTGGGISVSASQNKQPDSSAMLDASDPSRGFLLTRTTPSAISSPENGLIIYDITTNNILYFYNNNWSPLCAVTTLKPGATGQQSSVGVAINSTGAPAHPSAILDVASSDKGILIPRLSDIQRDQILPVTGLAIYNTDAQSIEYFNGSSWLKLNTMVPAGVSISTGDVTVCEGVTVQFTATPVNGGDSPFFQWRVNSQYVPGENTSSFLYVPSDNDTITCQMFSSSPCASGNPAMSNPLQMTVNPLLPVSVQIHAANNPVCEGTLVQYYAVPYNGGDSPFFQWRVNGNYVPGENYSTFSYTPQNNDKITCQLISSYSCATGNPAISNEITMTVDPPLTVGITIEASANPVCSGTGVTFTATPVNGGDTPVYQWFVNANFAGTNNPVFTYTPVQGDLVWCRLTSSAPCVTGNPAESSKISMNVVANGQVNDPDDIVACKDAMTPAVVFTTVNTGGVTTYTWTNDNTGIGLAATGTGNIDPFAAANNSIAPMTATITVTPHFTADAITCDGPTKSFTITVNPKGQVNQPASQVVCNAAQTTQVLFTTVNTVGTTTYTWTNNKPSIGLAISGSGNINAFTANNTGTAPVFATITVTPHFTNESVTCDGPTKSFTITVNPTGQVNQPASQVVCNTAQTTQVVFTTANTVGTTTYTWTNNKPSIGLAISGSGNINAFTANNTGTAPVIATITVTPHFTNASVTCDGPTKSFTITVNPTGQVNQPAGQVVCNAAQTTQVVFTTVNTVGTTTYTWTNDKPSIGLAANGSGNISAFAAVNTGTAPVVATITVTPHFSNVSVTCDGPTKSFTITVNPAGQADQPASQVVCNAAQTTQVVFTTGNTGGSTTYSWTNDKPSIGLAANGSGNISAFTAVNTGTAPVVATIIVTRRLLQ